MHPASHPSHQVVYINSGELAFATSPCHIKTILGSCVGVILFDQRIHIGGMCHYLLAKATRDQRSTRYGDVAIPTLVEKLLENGSKLPDIKAWVAGGALLLDQHEIFFVGENNIKIADEILANYGIQVVQRVVAGDRGRRISLKIPEGKVTIGFIGEKKQDVELL